MTNTENLGFGQNAEEDFKIGQTVSIPREEFQALNIAGIPPEDDAVAFLQTIAEDPNIEGVAISKMEPAGIYTEWFVKRLIGSKEIARRTLDTTNSSYQFLAKIALDRAGYGGFITLGNRTFEEAESAYRGKFGQVDNEEDFSFGRPFHEGLDLQVIFRFT